MSTTEFMCFGAFRYDVTQRLLLEGNRIVRMGSRVAEILSVLLESPGEIVSQRELMKRVWSGTCVGDGTLRVHISSLRRLLAADRSVARHVETVNGLGYRFVAPWTREYRAPVHRKLPTERCLSPDCGLTGSIYARVAYTETDR